MTRKKNFLILPDRSNFEDNTLDLAKTQKIA